MNILRAHRVAQPAGRAARGHLTDALTDHPGLPSAALAPAAGHDEPAYLVDHLIPRVPVRQWVLSFPIPLRVLFAAHPELLTPVLRIVYRLIRLS